MIKVVNSSKEEFFQLIESKNVICFGAGDKFREFCEKYSVEDKIRYVVDNYKSGTQITINDCFIPAVAMDEVIIEEDDVMVITSLKFAKELIQQLDTIQKFHNQNIYIYELMTDAKSKEKVSLQTDREDIIPKKIHYCWFGNTEIPKQFSDNIETWKKYCPDYEFIRWSEDNYDITKNLYMKQAYEAKKWGFVPDYARLDIINTYGGIYLDTDVELLKSLDELLSYDFFCGFESVNWVAFGLGFGACKGNAILQEMMRDYESRQFINEDGTYNLVASPVYQTQVLERHGLIKDGHTQLIENGIILSPEFLAPINMMGVGNPTINSFSIHQYAATWLDKEQREDKEKLIEKCKYIINRIEKDN